MAVEFNLCEIILIMLVLGPKMLWDSIRTGSLKRSIKRRLEWAFSPIIEYRERRAPASFRPRFRRTLTPVPASVSEQGPARGEGRVNMHMHMQTQSRLFTLPLEIREMVYSEVLCVASLHLHKDDGIARVHGGLCTGRPITGTYWEGYDRARDNYRLRCAHMVDPNFYQPESSLPGIGLLRICRRVYSETVDILYERNTFSLNQHALNALPRTIIPGRLECIRNLRVYISLTTAHDRAKWIRASRILEQLSGLRSLQVSFARISHPSDGSPRIRIREGMALVKPLLGLRVSDFVVEAPQSALDDGLVIRDPSWSDVPFRARLWRTA
ncbi:hypothetical protein BJY00DRAFT_293680 [Aspergillus carlsbadensis]|nr:hypothetical protein BJY00DRAFT_293680 [Aspergillus carlsbadensis]